MTFVEKICRALDDAGVRFALVGGYAVALHGVPRGTIDVNLALRWTLEDLVRAGEIAMSRTGGPKVVQRFSDEYIERCRDLSPRDIARFLEDYGKLFGTAKRQRGQRTHRETESR